ncbi:amino acid adenylation domain-containing protein [Aquitalea sp. S1-19]|nr:amino acid adenylation domain-containing protein [Aquitalea sp. S1-19]
MSYLLDRLEASFLQYADKAALTQDGWTLSFRELDGLSAGLAGRLMQEGIKPGQWVPLLMKRSIHAVLAMLAVARCGAVYVPLDMASPASRREKVLTQLNALLLLADPDVAEAMPGVRVLVPQQVQACAAPLPVWPEVDDHAPLYAMFTSGSTGEPKGVVVPHRGVFRLVCETDYARFDAEARWALLSSLAFDASTLEIWAPLLNGGCCVVQGLALPDLQQLGEFLQSKQITDAWLTAALFNMLVDDAPGVLSGLRQLFTGGERVSPGHLRRAMAACPGLQLINGYGPTENTTFSLCHRIRAADVADDSSDVPIGRPIRGTLLQLMDDNGEPVASGETGELWLGGEGVALGYLGKPEETAKRFVEFDGQRWYRSGDRVRRRSDGLYEFVGRADRQVKLRGFRIELDEVEQAMLACTGVKEAVAWVDGQDAASRQLLAAFGGTLDEAALRRELATRLPPYMMPARLLALPKLPVNLNGKLDRQALVAQLAQTLQMMPAAGVLTPAQQQLADLWRQVLTVEVRAADSDFLGLGGSSLQAVKLSALIRERLGRELPAIKILNSPRLAEQTEWLASAPCVLEAEVVGEALALTASQQAVLRGSLAAETAAAYLVPTALLFECMQPGRLAEAFARLGVRHPLLRARVRVGDSQVSIATDLPEGWWQLHAPLAWAAGKGDWPAALLDAIYRPMDPLEGAMRVDCWPLAGGRLLCVWTVQHYVIDEVAVHQVLRELDALLRGETLPSVGSIRAFAGREWQDEAQIHATALQMAQTLDPSTIPLARLPAAGGEQVIALDCALQARLGELARALDSTAFIPCLLAWGVALQQCFGETRRFVLTPFSRRDEAALLEPVGYCLDLRLIEAGRRAEESWPAALERVRKAVLAAQGGGFASADAVAQALRILSPSLAFEPYQFALTWHQDAHQALQIGDQRVQWLHVPQTLSRFAVCLHLETGELGISARIEAVQAAFDAGHVTALARAFEAALESLCELPLEPMRRLPPAMPVLVSDVPDSVTDVSVRYHAMAAWQYCLGRMPEDDTTDFLQAGGSSLLAMQLLARLRQQGWQLNVGSFLSYPRFGHLCSLLRSAGGGGHALMSWMGPADATHVLLLIPGAASNMSELFHLSRVLLDRLTAEDAVVIVNVEQIMADAPSQDLRAHFVSSLQACVQSIGEARLSAVVGFSLGGVLALLAQDKMVKPAPVYLLDTLAPALMDRRWHAQTWRNVVRKLQNPQDIPAAIVRRLRKAPADAVQWQAHTVDHLRWHLLINELSAIQLQLCRLDVTLVVSDLTIRNSGVLFHRKYNGFDPSRFARFERVLTDLEHRDVVRSGVEQVVTVITQNYQGRMGYVA